MLWGWFILAALVGRIIWKVYLYVEYQAINREIKEMNE